MRLSNLPIYAFNPSWGWGVVSKIQFIPQKLGRLSFAKATCGSILQGQTLEWGRTHPRMPLAVARLMPSFSLKAAVLFSFSCPCFQRSFRCRRSASRGTCWCRRRTRTGSYNSIEDFNVIMIQFNLFIKSNHTCWLLPCWTQTGARCSG